MRFPTVKIISTKRYLDIFLALELLEDIANPPKKKIIQCSCFYKCILYCINNKKDKKHISSTILLYQWWWWWW